MNNLVHAYDCNFSDVFVAFVVMPYTIYNFLLRMLYMSRTINVHYH